MGAASSKSKKKKSKSKATKKKSRAKKSKKTMASIPSYTLNCPEWTLVSSQTIDKWKTDPGR